jgi:UDP-N-acetylmuramyl pentapeptide phosphotransferase/UDP-N-acetylglucosamine-1-phosphate transferase
MVTGISFVDDLSHVHLGIRISVHILAALTLVASGLVVDRLELPGLAIPVFPWAGAILTCLYVAWLVNLYNFMDGMDGFAGGMAVIGFGAFAVLGLMSGHWQFASISLIVAAAAGGFLLFNFPPARIFMGDLGASLLGFLAAGLSLWASAAVIFPIWVGVLIFSPFIVDASYTLARRLGRRERVWEAHKTHCYQRLVEHGWGHRKTVLWAYALMMLCALSAVAAMHLESGFQWALLSTWVVTYAILIAFVNLVGCSPDTS